MRLRHGHPIHHAFISSQTRQSALLPQSPSPRLRNSDSPPTWRPMFHVEQVAVPPRSASTQTALPPAWSQSWHAPTPPPRVPRTRHSYSNSRYAPPLSRTPPSSPATRLASPSTPDTTGQSVRPGNPPPIPSRTAPYPSNQSWTATTPPRPAIPQSAVA